MFRYTSVCKSGIKSASKRPPQAFGEPPPQVALAMSQVARRHIHTLWIYSD